jgi:hypothetical protein
LVKVGLPSGANASVAGTAIAAVVCDELALTDAPKISWLKEPADEVDVANAVAAKDTRPNRIADRAIFFLNGNVLVDSGRTVELNGKRVSVLIKGLLEKVSAQAIRLLPAVAKLCFGWRMPT